MGEWLATQVSERLNPGARVLVLWLTFKEDVPDLHNSGVANVIARLKSAGMNVSVRDAFADRAEAKHEYGIDLIPAVEGFFDAVVAAVAHRSYLQYDVARLSKLLPYGGLVADIKGI